MVINMKAICEIVKFNINDIVTESSVTPPGPGGEVCNPIVICDDTF